MEVKNVDEEKKRAQQKKKEKKFRNRIVRSIANKIYGGNIYDLTEM